VKKLLWAMGITLITMLCLVITGCGSEKADNGKLYVYNWGDYIDPSVIDSFEEEYGIDVVYETFATNEDMYVKVAAKAGQYDVVIPSEYMIKKMMNEDMLCTIDTSKLTNYDKIGDRFKNLAFDPDNEYNVPYMWGTLGILYNTTMVDETVDSWDIMWDPKYEKQIFMMDSVRDTMCVALKRLGYSMNTKNPDELAKAQESLFEQKPLVLSYVGDEGKDAIIGGEAALGLFYSGDAAYCISQNPDLAYAIPKEGTNYWFDSMCIPKTAQNIEGAYLFIDYMCRTEIGALNEAYIEYASPLTEVIEQLSAEKTNNPAYYPEEKDLTGCEVYEDLGADIAQYDKIWTELKAY